MPTSKNNSLHPLTNLVAQLSENGALITNSKGEVEWVNDAFCTLTGYTPAEFEGKLPESLLRGKDSDPETIQYMEGKISLGEAFTAEILNYTKSGHPYWASLQYHPITTKDVLSNYVVVVKDLTEQKKNEEAIRESEQRFRHLANSAPALIWMINESQQYEYFNQAWLNFTATTHKSAEGRRLVDFLHPDDQKAWLETLDKACQEKKDLEMEFRLQHHTGEYKIMLNRGTPKYSDAGQFTGFIGSCLDVTEMKEAQQRLEEANLKLRDSENKLNAFFNSTTDTNFLLGPPPSYPVLAFNKTAANVIKGLFHTDLEIGDSFLDYTVEDVKPKFKEDMAKALAGETVHEERKVGYDAGVVVYWKATYQPAYDDEDNIIGVAFNVTNIDAQRKYEIALEEKNQKLEEIAQLQSHEIRRPVASLLGLINLLNPNKFHEENRALVEMVHNTVHEMDNIIHRVVELTYETDTISPFDPNQHDSGRKKL